jgi:hypothetical protein
MTPQEQQLIDGLISRIRSTPPTEKDDEVDRYLHQNLDNVPDALYMLAQTVLVQQYGLQNAQEQLEALKQELNEAHTQQRPPQRSGSFLGRIFGGDNQQQPPPSQQGYQPVNAGYPSGPPYGAPGYPPPGAGYGPPYGGQPMYPEPGYGMGGGFGSGGPGGFLRNAMQTAAGVAAGEMAFRGIEDLFHGFGHEGRGFEGGDRPSETINNYYDTDRPEGHEHHDSTNFSDAVRNAGDQPLSSDIEDRRFADTGDSLADNDQQGFEDSGSNDDGSYDDGGSFDDGGSNDDSSN